MARSMNPFMQKLAAPFVIIKIIAKHEPLYLVFALPQMVLNAALPLLYVYFPKLIIDQLTGGHSYGNVVRVITIYTCVLMFTNITNVFLKHKSSMHSTIFLSRLKNKTGKISMHLELKDIESPKSRDMIQMANKAADLTSAIELVQNIVSSIITIAGLAYIIIRLDWLIILLVMIILAVKTVFVYKHYLYGKKTRLLDAENNRHGNYLYDISLSSEGGAKEIRLNTMQKWYMEKVTRFRNAMLKIQYRDFKRHAIYNIVMAILMALQSFIILWLLSIQYINKVITIADFTMVFSAVITLTANLSSISEQIGSYYRQILDVSDYKKSIDIAEKQNKAAVFEKPDFLVPDKIEFFFQDVSFTYPNTDKQVLRNVRLKISYQEKLVIVGMNGAGKSTFIKLLCKFYRPTSGTITMNGVDIWDIPNDDYYKILSAVFQDFTNLPFKVKENISMDEDGDMEIIKEIMSGVGLKETIDNLPDGYETYLTKSFDSGGIELSGGQAQKIAIARAVYKNSPVLILDEPTANLDPKAESEIYTDFFKLAKDKTTIFISHRLAASTIADHIAVFSNGKITEYGSHIDLMKQNGIYAEMYRKQSQQYADDKVLF